ncbi:MAG TPA: hypothetical protein VLI92_04280 [Candidatus Saccharimonadales bacterium]|nr:hypothetical protein [Candidatus Saccharimonadales bacterium]
MFRIRSVRDFAAQYSGKVVLMHFRGQLGSRHVLIGELTTSPLGATLPMYFENSDKSGGGAIALRARDLVDPGMFFDIVPEETWATMQFSSDKRPILG